MNRTTPVILMLCLLAFVLPAGSIQQNTCEISPGAVKFEWHGQAYSINVLPSINGGDTGGSSGYDGSASFVMAQTRGVHVVEYTSGNKTHIESFNFSVPGCYDLTESD